MSPILAFTVYITAQSLQAGFHTDAERARAVKQLHDAGATAVVIESYRGGLSLDEGRLAEIRDRFKEEGFEALGGLMPVSGEGFGEMGKGIETRLPFFCYSSEATVSSLEGEIRKLARLFDRVVIDDGFLTSCQCDTCNAARQTLSWPEFRRNLLTSVAERWVKAAHAENTDVILAVKFPQYYDRLHLFGYDAQRFPQVFDAVWVGTETRDPETPKYGFTEPYQGYFNIRWMKACAGAKFESAWIDYLDCSQRLFEQQAYTSALGQPPRTILFCFGPALLDERAPGMAARLPQLTQVWEKALEPWGVSVVKPPNSDGGGDLFMFDDLGMLGIPCVPSTRLDANMRSAIVTGHSLASPGAEDTILAILKSGGQVIVTHQALRNMVNRPELLAEFGYLARNISTNRALVRAIEANGQTVPLDPPIEVPGDLAPEEGTEVLAYGVFGTWSDSRVPFVTRKKTAQGGTAIVWNVGTFGNEAYSAEEHLCVPVKTGLSYLSQPVANLLRNTALAPIGLHIDAPARVGVYLFSKNAVLFNYNDCATDVSIEGLPIVDPAPATPTTALRRVSLSPNEALLLPLAQ